jgi:hypothetical protein
LQISERNCEESQCYQRGTTVKEKETKFKELHTHSSFDSRLDPIQCAADVLKTNCSGDNRVKNGKVTKGHSEQYLGICPRHHLSQKPEKLVE